MRGNVFGPKPVALYASYGMPDKCHQRCLPTCRGSAASTSLRCQHWCLSKVAKAWSGMFRDSQKLYVEVSFSRDSPEHRPSQPVARLGRRSRQCERCLVPSYPRSKVVLSVPHPRSTRQRVLVEAGEWLHQEHTPQNIDAEVCVF